MVLTSIHDVWPQVWTLGKYNNQNNVWQVFFEVISQSRRSTPLPSVLRTLDFLP